MAHEQESRKNPRGDSPRAVLVFVVDRRHICGHTSLVPLMKTLYQIDSASKWVFRVKAGAVMQPERIINLFSGLVRLSKNLLRPATLTGLHRMGQPV